jgi:hypothetical protein
MKNHILMKEASLLRHGPSFFYKNNQHEGPFKWNHSPSNNKSSRKNHKGSTHGYSVYPKDHSFKVIRAVTTNTLAPPLKHVPPKNLSYTYHSDHLKMHNPQ